MPLQLDYLPIQQNLMHSSVIDDLLKVDLSLSPMAHRTLELSQRLLPQISLGKVCSDIEARKINDEVGFGVFATSVLRADTFVCDYRGIICTDLDLDMAIWKPYLFEYPSFGLPTDRRYFIDAEHAGNVGRFLNHSKRPNCRYEYLTFDGRWVVGLFTDRDIAPGEQLVYDYGSLYWEQAAKFGIVCRDI